jgi:ATP-dependent DNA helicase 2 subunit 2
LLIYHSGVDFDDAEFGFKEENKNSIKVNIVFVSMIIMLIILQATNEVILKGLVDKCEEGVFGTAAAAIEDISVPRVKEVRPFASYKGQLMLGDPEKYDTAMCIDVERYTRTKVAKPPSASSFVVSESAALESGPSSHTLANTGDVEMGETGVEGLSSVKNSRTYKVIDESAPGGKRDVDRDELASGYEYGRTAVYISESDLNVTKLETVQSFSIVGFIPTTGVS